MKFELETNIIRLMVETHGLHGFAVILNNAFVHGEIVPEIDQDGLNRIYNAIEQLDSVAKDS